MFFSVQLKCNANTNHFLAGANSQTGEEPSTPVLESNDQSIDLDTPSTSASGNVAEDVQIGVAKVASKVSGKI